MKLYQIQSQISTKLALVLCIVIMLSACSPIPIAVVCPPFPSPPPVLMQPPPTQYLLDSVLKPRSN